MAREDSLLELEVHRLTSALEHLESSNSQLQEALKEAFDREFKTAIEDNIVTIAKYRARRAALQEEIQRLKGLAPTERVHEPQGVALPDVQRTADQQQGNSALPTPSTSPPAVAAAAAAAATTTATASATPVGQQQQQQQQHTPLEHIPPQPALEDSSRGHAEEEQAGTGVWL